MSATKVNRPKDANTKNSPSDNEHEWIRSSLIDFIFPYVTACAYVSMCMWEKEHDCIHAYVHFNLLAASSLCARSRHSMRLVDEREKERK